MAQSIQTDFELRLAASHQSRFSGRSLRDTLDILSQATHVDYWLDRRVDSGFVVDVPLTGPTVEQAFSNIANAAGLVSLPVDNLVLVGRADWVDHAGTLILAAGAQAQPGNVNGQPGPSVSDVPHERAVALQWPLLTTPKEALQIVAAALKIDAGSIQLPHDLWPAFSNDAIRPTTILTLIGCEFDIWLHRNGTGALKAEAFPDQISIEKAYPVELVANMKAEIEQLDSTISIRQADQQSLVRGSARVHRLLQSRARGERAPTARPRQGPPVTTQMKRFTIHWQRAPAEKALQSLAQAGGWTLAISPAARGHVAKLIDLKAEDMQLTDLVRKVAEQVELQATWDDDTLSVDVR